MPQFSTLVQKSFVRGASASPSRYEQPRGSLPRLSNFLMSRRGALKTCDGTIIIGAFGGQPQTPSSICGRIAASILFQPVGVQPYFLLLQELLSLNLGAPGKLTAIAVGGGTLPSATYFYRVTALDGVGGETTASNQVSVAVLSGHGTVNLSWNPVPNAVSYNVYRSTFSGTETLLIGNDLPIAATTFSDTGADSTIVVYNISSPAGATSGYLPAENLTTFDFRIAPSNNIQVGQQFTVAGCTPSGYNNTYTCAEKGGFGRVIATLPGNVALPTGVGGTLTPGPAGGSITPPTVDTTQQTGLFALPGSVGYDLSNIVGLFPADAVPIGKLPSPPAKPTGPPGTPINTGGGGSGGGGGTGGGPPTGSPSSTPSGGYPPGNLSSNPQMVQFVNQIVLALGNGFPCHVFSDPTGTPDNPATVCNITSISVDAFGTVTVNLSTPHGLQSTQVGANVVLQGITNTRYNTNGQGVSAFPVISIPSTTQLTLRNLNALGQAASSGGTLTVSTQPLISTFSAAYPNWSVSTTHLVGDIVQPDTPNGFYYTYTQSGITGPSAPTFPLVKGQQVADGTAILTNSGPTQSNSPPPPGAGHCAVYAGSLWLWDTSPNNTSNGLDGPTVLAMSDQGNPFSWNPVNRAFLDKDDGTEGMGLVSFTVTATGIPPQGSLVACKNYSTYQIIGVFGAADFAIQRIKSDMGCIAPRTLRFVPGFGIGRLTHLGIAIFDSVEDKLISEDIRPFLFPSNDIDLADITVMDANWAFSSQADLVANPPMYTMAIPIGASQGMLTRLLCYDLVLKSWGIIDLPFAISNVYQARSAASNPITLLGSWGDGTYQRWQAGDMLWATSSMGSSTPSLITASLRTPETVNMFPMAPDTGIMYYYQLIIRGRFTDMSSGAIDVQLNMQEEGYVEAYGQLISLGQNGMFEYIVPIQEELVSVNALITVTSTVEIDSINWQVKPLSTALPARIT